MHYLFRSLSMNTAKFSFTILQYSGVWRPKSLTSQWAIKLYNLYSFLIFFAFITILISLFMYIILVKTDVESLTENIMLFVGILALNLKVTYVLIQRDDIIHFDNMFLEIHCSPRDSDEFAILKSIHSSNRLNTIRFLVGCYTYFAINFLFLAFFSKDISLPMKAWTPYNVEPRLQFWLTYLHEVLVMTIMINAQVALDGLAIGMMQQICGQLDIIKHRLYHMDNIDKTDKKNINIIPHAKFLKECLKHHSYVYLIGKKLNNILGWLAFFMFMLTIIALCAVIYQFSVLSPNSIKFWSIFAASNSYLFEIFLYCWYGQELIEKSLSIADVAYEIDWTNLTNNSRKCLILIILRSAKPIELKGLSIVTMSLQTFLKILKVSYSTFNLIQSL